jgi:hypothetical protein
MLPLLLRGLGVDVRWFMREFVDRDVDGDTHVFIEALEQTVLLEIPTDSAQRIEAAERLVCDALACRADLVLTSAAFDYVQLSRLRRR